MKYNFDEIVPRRDTGCVKYDECGKRFGKSDLIPLWVADMDFPTAQPVIDACVAKARHGIWGYSAQSESYF